MRSAVHRLSVSTLLLFALCWSCSSDPVPAAGGGGGGPGGGAPGGGGPGGGDAAAGEGGTLDGGGEGGASEAGPFNPYDGGNGACNQLAVGASVGETIVATTTPAPTGGVIGDGNYILTARTFYSGNFDGDPNGHLAPAPLARTIVVSGMSFQTAELIGASDPDAGVTPERRSWTYQKFGSVLSEMATCPFPSASARNSAYSVVGNELWIFPTRATREIYTRQ